MPGPHQALQTPMNDILIPCPPVLSGGRLKQRPQQAFPGSLLDAQPSANPWTVSSGHSLPSCWRKSCVHVFLPLQCQMDVLHLQTSSADPYPDRTNPVSSLGVLIRCPSILLLSSFFHARDLKCWQMCHCSIVEGSRNEQKV